MSALGWSTVGGLAVVALVLVVTGLVRAGRRDTWKVEPKRETYRRPWTLGERVVTGLWSATTLSALGALGLLVATVWTDDPNKVDAISRQLGNTAALLILLTAGLGGLAAWATVSRKKLDHWWVGR